MMRNSVTRFPRVSILLYTELDRGSYLGERMHAEYEEADPAPQALAIDPSVHLGISPFYGLGHDGRPVECIILALIMEGVAR